MLRHCLAPSLRRQLNELPPSLDDTYERVLKEIQSTNQGRYAHRLLQCLVVAIRPLRVDELAEVLSYDLDVAKGEIPTFHPEWRWEEQEQAVLSACSSLISVVGKRYFRVVQFSHFSVKEYLTSDRLAASSGDISRYHILPEPAHFTLAQASLGVLLSFYYCVNNGSDGGGGEDSHVVKPLLEYAAKHWVFHAQVGNVSSRLKNAMENLFDPNQPYFSAWVQLRYLDSHISYPLSNHTPLYYSALYGFYDLVRHLIAKHPEQVNDRGGDLNSPLVAALSRKHLRVAELLVQHGAHVNISGGSTLFQAIECTDYADWASVDAIEFLLKHGADVNATEKKLWTPLHLASDSGYPLVVLELLEHGAELDPRDNKGRTPLHLVSARTIVEREDEPERFLLAQLLVTRGADVQAQDDDNATPLHFASYHGRADIVKLLLDQGANAGVKDNKGRSSLHEVSPGIHRYKHYHSGGEYIPGDRVYPPKKAFDVALLLVDLNVDVNALDNDHTTPLHLASSHGILEVARLLLERGATANAKNVHGQTPLHLVSQSEAFSHENSEVARLLLEIGMDANVQDNCLATPLHFACSHGNFETALVLLDHGAEPNAQNADGQTPLHRVSQGSNFDDDPRVAQLMLERGAEVNARDQDQETPLHLALHKSKTKTVQVLLDHGVNVNVENIRGQTPLHLASLLLGTYSHNSDPGPSGPEVVRLLLGKGADVNAQDKDLASPLHLASSHVTSETAQALLGNGADVDAVNIHGQNSLHIILQTPFNCYTPVPLNGWHGYYWTMV
jgi:ankyrin repeat protein